MGKRKAYKCPHCGSKKVKETTEDTWATVRSFWCTGCARFFWADEIQD